jgi:hypothetical protein
MSSSSRRFFNLWELLTAHQGAKRLEAGLGKDEAKVL